MPYLLLLFGLLLIFLEFYLPGAILGTIGALVIVASLVVFIMQTQYWWESFIFFPLVVISVVVLIKYALWRIPRTRSDYSIYSADDQEGFQASSFDQTAIGKIGTALTDLKPGGYILIEDVQHQAISETGYIAKGESVQVERGEGESLIVKSVKKE